MALDTLGGVSRAVSKTCNALNPRRNDTRLLNLNANGAGGLETGVFVVQRSKMPYTRMAAIPSTVAFRAVVGSGGCARVTTPLCARWPTCWRRRPTTRSRAPAAPLCSTRCAAQRSGRGSRTSEVSLNVHSSSRASHWPACSDRFGQRCVR